MLHAALYSLHQDGYATSTTTSDDPEDQASQQHPSTQFFQHAPKRLGGRKTDPLITGMTDCSALLAGQEQQQQQQPTLSSSSYPHINNNSIHHQQQQQRHPYDVAAMNVNTTTNHTIMGKRNSMQFDEICRRQSMINSNKRPTQPQRYY
jgi:hypothetical protein